jgi:Kdo2-lipid IVA lauroyltransferase/acyltransferase
MSDVKLTNKQATVVVVRSYSFRPSAFASETHYLLTPDQLTWADGAGRISYRDVAQIKVYQRRFWGSSRLYWTCKLYPYKGRRIYLSAAHRLSLRKIEDRTRTYIPFIKDLEARIATTNSKALFVVGRGWLSRIENVAGWVAVQILRQIWRFDPDRTADGLAGLMRKIGPLLRGHRTARTQLRTAFPEKNSGEIEKLLDGMWDNIGRVVAEYGHLGTLWDFDPARPNSGRILIDDVVAERLLQLGRSREPALMFGAHLANWELLGLAARAHGRDIILVYREPKIAPIAHEIVRIRNTGVAGLIPAAANSPLKIRNALRRNCLVGMLVDQYDANGIEVNFFKRSCRVNSVLGRMARLFECPIYGARVVRLPDGRYQLEMTEPLTLPRDHEGKINVTATMQMVTSIIEGWVCDHPEQWMWTHRRWR